MIGITGRKGQALIEQDSNRLAVVKVDFNWEFGCFQQFAMKRSNGISLGN
jgi:hypothetical protein